MNPKGILDAFADTGRFRALRRDIHAHTELGVEEHRTASLVADMPAASGITVHRGIAGNGVVGVLRGRGTHASMPHTGLDPAGAALEIAQTLQPGGAHHPSPERALLAVTPVQGSDAPTEIPDQAWVDGTVRTFSVEAIDRIEQRLRRIAYTGKERSRFLPDLPTAAESGLPGYAFDSWTGLLAPAALPRAELERIDAALRQVLAQPAVQERLARLGVESRAMAVDDFHRLLRADWDNAGAIVKASGAKVE